MVDSHSTLKLSALWNRLFRKRRTHIRPEDIRAETATLLYAAVRPFTSMFESYDGRSVWEDLYQIETELGDICRLHSGQVLSTFNGSVLTKFTTAPGALRAALDAVEQLNTTATDSSQAYPNRLRPQLIYGLHTGPLYVVGDRCYGSSINTAMRVCGLVVRYSTPNTPGDVIVSGPTAALLPPQIQPGYKLLHVADFRIIGKVQPLDLFLVVRIELTLSTFISYRREGGAEIARLISSQLQRRGVTTFLDIDDLGSQCFDDRIFSAIESVRNFILILSPGSLDRCSDENDWLRKEIAYAFQHRKNIVPIYKEGFVFPDSSNLPRELEDLRRYNCVTYSHEYFDASLDRLVSFLV